MRNRFTKILIISFLLVLTSVMFCYAGEDDSPSSPVIPLAPDITSMQVYPVAQDIAYELNSDPVRATTYTTTDIYNFLYAAMMGQNYNSSYSLPVMTSYLNRISQLLGGPGQAVPSSTTNSISGRLSTMSSNITNLKSYLKDIRDIFVLGSVDGAGGITPLGDALDYIIDFLPSIYSTAGQIHADGQNNTYYLSNISNSISDLTSYRWTNTSVSPSWYLDSNNQVISSSRTGTKFSVVFQNFYSTASDIPLLYRIYVPIMSSSLFHVVSDFDLSVGYFDPSDNSVTDVDTSVDYYLEPTTRGTYIYLFGFRPQNVSYVTFTLTGNVQYDSSYTGSVSVMSFDTDSYQQIKQAFVADRSNNFLEYLANNLVDPSMQQAKQESQEVIDDTLDGFTGDGAAAAKGSDTGSMKNVSSNLRTGLDTGAGVSNAINVFSTDSGFWGWFTQQNSDLINNPYPAPVVTPTRSGNGDQIVDFISSHDDDVNDLLGGSTW